MTKHNSTHTPEQSLGTAAEKPVVVSRKAAPSLGYELAMLGLKIAVVIGALVALFSFVFGLYRVNDATMEPVFLNGDIVMYYRLDRRCYAGEVVVLPYEGSLTSARVIAVAGDEVDIDTQGLKVNGSYQQEQRISGETTQVADGVTFPLTIPDGCLFLLGDNRTEAVDSRIYGCVSSDDINGKVIGQFRRRGF